MTAVDAVDAGTLPWLLDADVPPHHLAGTDRARTASQTWRMAAPVGARIGVTRLADLTRLDTLGIPTFQAVRPLSRTLAVSQGKGITAELARLSALMESIELWHVEQPVEAELVAAPHAVADRLGYPVEALPRTEPSLLHDRLPVAWTTARSLVDGAPALVPVEVVTLTLTEHRDWTPPAFLASTNGLASGNTLAEAVLHGLYEVVERDAVAAQLAGGPGDVVDPASAGSPLVDGLGELVELAGAHLEVRHLPSPTGLPCFSAWLACPDYPAAMSGFGCHRSSEIALTRAITEAAQSRVGYIAGARDDLEGDIDTPAHHRTPVRGPRTTLPQLRARGDLDGDTCRDVGGERTGTLAADLADVVERVRTAFGHAPLVVDLTRPDLMVPVVKVVVPGARVDTAVL